MTTTSPGNASAPTDSADVRERILDIIAREGMIERSTIKPESTLDDLGVQSIDVVVILNAIEDELKIFVPIDQTLNDIKTADDLVAAIIKIYENPPKKSEEVAAQS